MSKFQIPNNNQLSKSKSQNLPDDALITFFLDYPGFFGVDY